MGQNPLCDIATTSHPIPNDSLETYSVPTAWKGSTDRNRTIIAKKQDKILNADFALIDTAYQNMILFPEKEEMAMKKTST